MDRMHNPPLRIHVEAVILRVLAIIQVGYGIYWVYATLTLASGLFSSLPISIEVWGGIVFIVLGSFSQVVYSLPLAIGLWKNRLWAVVMAFIVHILHLSFNFFRIISPGTPFIGVDFAFVVWHIIVIVITLFLLLRRLLQGYSDDHASARPPSSPVG